MLSNLLFYILFFFYLNAAKLLKIYKKHKLLVQKSLNSWLFQKD
ncbi:hypothetical protein HMPREF3218_0202059 [Prevotella bivia]|uniref:Uncharacterized protein n=1 Tax=Prevotella bivia TaxID=28125 RepID=A0A137SPN0_9BACT|nr:hypothetical protein HMPREF3202_02468 [Prevotella bivia]KXU56337.1 hypothetical protein HMPREF3218_0202059 [Prevotella bivia]